LYLEKKKELGYSLNGVNVSSLAYADDFAIITRNRRSHQKLIKDINEKVESMGLKVKPAKCRSFSICAGKPTSIIFNIDSHQVPSIETDEQKFLGQKIFFTDKEKDRLAYLKVLLEEKLTNIDKVLIRSEYKLAIYSRYLLPSLQFILTVHSLTKTSLDQLDNLTEKFLKKWTGLPPCATRVIIHYKKTLNIPTITDTYIKGHSRAYFSTWVKGDERTDAAMNNKVTREVQNKKPLKLAALTKARVTEKKQEMGISSPIPTIETKQKILKLCTKNYQDELDLEHKYATSSKIDTYQKQGDFLKLVSEMEADIAWKSYIYNVPKGTMKFILNASINTLPTLSNLMQWGKSSTDKCPHCSQKETLFHILNGCKTGLDQGRYTWRHDSLVNYLYKVSKTSSLEVYADLPGKTTSTGGTVPADVLVTSERPDLILLDRAKKEIFIYELTVAFETRIEAAHSLKSDKYAALGDDLFSRGWKVNYHIFEVGSRGHMPQHTKESMYKILKLTDEPMTPKKFYSIISKLIVLCSYKLFIARKETEWISPPYLEPYP